MKKALFFVMFTGLLFAAFGQSDTEAARLRREGDRFFNEARAALANNDFAAARNMVERAATAYDRSLELEHDESTWIIRTVSILELDIEITEKFSAETIRQVRELIGRIEESYFAGDFDRAEQLITDAENIWKQTQANPNGELEYWSYMIRQGKAARPKQPTSAEIIEAQTIVDANRQTVHNSRGYYELNDVISKLDRAIQLDPHNEEAKSLKDFAARNARYINNMGITFEAEKLFQQASQAVIENKPLQAQQLLKQIYALNPDLKFAPKVKTLQQRVDSML